MCPIQRTINRTHLLNATQAIDLVHLLSLRYRGAAIVTFCTYVNTISKSLPGAIIHWQIVSISIQMLKFRFNIMYIR